MLFRPNFVNFATFAFFAVKSLMPISLRLNVCRRGATLKRDFVAKAYDAVA